MDYKVVITVDAETDLDNFIRWQPKICWMILR